ncbi:MAG: DUF4153 domain-containing protein [Spirochaetota bacterium]
MIYVVGHKNADKEITKLTLPCAMGLVSFLSIRLWAERKQVSKSFLYALRVLVLFTLCLYYFFLPKDWNITTTIFFLLINFALHLSVAFAAYIGSEQAIGFWQFNKEIFIRILASMLYSGVLFLGIIIAFFAIDFLFDFKIKDTRYFQLFLFLAGVFNTWFFVSGIPKDFELLNQQQEYPKGLKVFTQYILLPLVAMYLLILYAYGIKILWQQSWPRGGVVYLITFLSIPGILCHLLLHPLRFREGFRWVNRVIQFFYLLLIPILLLLLLSISKRISEYGFTEKRYIILAGSLWLMGLSFFQIWNKSKSIKIIPMSLCLILICISFGPWGVFYVSQKSQLQQLKQILLNNKLLQNDKLVQNLSITPQIKKNINSKLRYLEKRNALEQLRNWLPNPVSESKILVANDFRQVLGLEKTFHDASLFYYEAADQKGVPVAGYNYLYFLHTNYSKSNSLDLAYNLSLSWDLKKSNELVVKERSRVRIVLNLTDVVKKLSQKGIQNDNYILREEMVLVGKDSKFKFKVLLTTISGYNNKKEYKINNFSGKLLIGKN